LTFGPKLANGAVATFVSDNNQISKTQVLLLKWILKHTNNDDLIIV
jgi:hypothetical protein